MKNMNLKKVKSESFDDENPPLDKTEEGMLKKMTEESFCSFKSSDSEE